MSDIQTEAYSKYLAQLTDVLRCNSDACLKLGTELVSRRLISSSTLKEACDKSGIARALAVLNAVRPTIRGSPDAFKELIESLQQETILCPVAASMQREVDSVGSVGNVTSDPTAASRALTPTSTELGERNPGSLTCD